MPIRRHWPAFAAAFVLLAAVLWLRGPAFGFNVWNVDEAIHAAAARVILDGGVLYRDASDGAEFNILGRDGAGAERALFRRLLQPRQEAADRGVQSFRVNLPAGTPGELILRIEPGPAASPASDWTFGSDLMLETFH